MSDDLKATLRTLEEQAVFPVLPTELRRLAEQSGLTATNPVYSK